MQEEFEQVMAIYKVHEDSLAQEEEDVSTSSCDDTKSTLEPSSPPAVSPVTSMCMVPVPVFSIPVFYPAAAQVTSVGVLYNGSTANGIVPRTATQLQICCRCFGCGNSSCNVPRAAAQSQVSCNGDSAPTWSKSTPQRGLDEPCGSCDRGMESFDRAGRSFDRGSRTVPHVACSQNSSADCESSFSCHETTIGTASALDDEDDLPDSSFDWIRAVSEGTASAPVERTFIQFNAHIKVINKRSRSR